jgi:hypothetical protein|tara:strand:+ start:205 stop:708 length:504 start_codon:yes stop_codon:yes gene_type:complete
MAYQKLQAGKAWSVNPSDNTDIPNTGLDGVTGTTTTGSATQLIDAARTGTDVGNLATLNFLEAGIQMGMIIVNITDSTQTTVKQVVNGTTLTVDQNIFAVTGKSYAIYGGNQEGAVLYVGTAGNLRVTTVAGDDVIFMGINTGAFFPVHVRKVWATNNTASNIIALW